MRIVEAYKPTSADYELAIKGGMKYVAGVGILHDPEDAYKFHHLHPDSEAGAQHIVDRAKRLIHAGIGQVIRYSNHPQIRSSLHQMERAYEAALPNMMQTHIRLYAEGRAERFFPLIAALAPLPVLDDGIYKRFCHGNFDSIKLPLAQMMDDVSIDERLEDYTRPNH
jgi:hypothetical protein